MLAKLAKKYVMLSGMKHLAQVIIEIRKENIRWDEA